MATRPEPQLDDTDSDEVHEASIEELRERARRGGRTPEEQARFRAFVRELEGLHGPADPRHVERYRALLKEAFQATDHA